MGLNEKKRLEFLSVFVCWQRVSNWIYNILFLFYKIFINYQNTPKHTPILSKSKFFRGRFVVFLPSCEIWSDCNTSNHAPSCGLRLPFSSSRPILPFRRLLFVSALSVMRPHKKAYIHKKTQKSFVTLLPMAESLVSHGFHSNKTHILTLLPFVTAPVFWM